jgi:hypothetical protein
LNFIAAPFPPLLIYFDVSIVNTVISFCCLLDEFSEEENILEMAEL